MNAFTFPPAEQAGASGAGLTCPSIHLNGSSRVSLTCAYLDAIKALDEALAKLAETAPNGRDYYPQGDGAMRAAQREHQSRMDRVRAVRAEAEQMAEAIVAAPGRA